MSPRLFPLFLCLLLLSCLTHRAGGVEPVAGEGTVDPIVGGEQAVVARPWMAALISNAGTATPTNRNFCGGTLIAPSWVLTAAHCVDSRPGPTFQVALGSLDLDAADLPLYEVAEVVVHPFWDDVLLRNDIALIRLKVPSSNPPADLATPEMTSAAIGSTVQVIGWGHIRWQPSADCTMVFPDAGANRDDYQCKTLVYDPGFKPAELMQTELTLQPFSECDERYKAVLDSRDIPRGDGPFFTEPYSLGLLCAWDTDEQTTPCHGDSGGPLFRTIDGAERVVGIASGLYGTNCASTLQLGMYTRVSHYAEFIDYTLGRNLALGASALCPQPPSPAVAYEQRGDGRYDVRLSWAADARATGFSVLYKMMWSPNDAPQRIEVAPGMSELSVVLRSGTALFVAVQARSAHCDSALSPLLTVTVP